MGVKKPLSDFTIVAGCKFHPEATERVAWYASVRWCLTPFRPLAKPRLRIYGCMIWRMSVLTVEIIL